MGRALTSGAPRSGSRRRAARVPAGFLGAVRHRVLLAALLLLALPTLARADVEVDVQPGHGGVAISRSATPIAVTLRSRDAAAVEVTIELSTEELVGVPDVVQTRTVRLPPGAERREVFLYPAPSTNGVEFSCRVSTSPRTTVLGQQKRGDRGVLSLRAPALDLAQPAMHTIGVVGDPRRVLAARLPTAQRTDSFGGVPDVDRLAVLAVDPETLRLGPLALDGIETVVLCDPDSETTGSPAETEGLLDWVALGGRLVISLGDNAPRFASSPLAAHLPAAFGGAQPGDLVAVAEGLGTDFGKLRPKGAAPGRVVALADRGAAAPPGSRRIDALRAERRLGRGEIVVFGFDLRAVALLLPGEERAVRPVAAHLADLNAWKRREQAAAVPGTDPDLQTPLAALLRGDAFRPPSAVIVFFALVAYLLVVGPLDWFILKKMKKERLTTVTFAAAVALFSVVAYGASFLLFGADAQTNRVVFVALEDGGREGRIVARVHEVNGTYMPVRGTRELRPALPAAFLGGGLPGLGTVGGVGTPSPLRVTTADPATQAAEMTVGFRSQRIAVALQAGAFGRSLDVRDAGGSGWRLENGLPVTIESALLFLPSGRRVEFGRAAPGDGVSAAVTSSRADWSATDPADVAADGRAWRSVLGSIAMPEAAQAHGSQFEAMLRTGIARLRPSSGSRRGVLVAFAKESPVALSTADEGVRYVVVTREVELP